MKGRISPGSRGFTLTELLVTISIIALLAGLISVGVPRAMEAGKKAKAKADLLAIVAAVKAYRQEYGRYPCRVADYQRGEYSSWFGPPTEEADGRILMRILSGENIAFTGETVLMNPKQVRFLEGVKISTGRRDTTGGTFTDPWGTQYAVKMDTEDSGGLEYYDRGNTENIRVGVIAVSFGPDKTQSDPNRVQTRTFDDVFSWEDRPWKK